MIDFRITKRSRRSRARLGLLRTPHGEVETPCLVTVATQAAVKALWNDQAERAGAGLLIANTYHLHLKPGERAVKALGGVHEFMNWSGPLMTDSGGYQVFSLGFGRDHGAGKVAKSRRRATIREGQQPRLLKIDDDGVHFTSYLDGRRLFIGPRESIRIQEALGADIMVAFDECPSPSATKAYLKKSLMRTHRWAADCLRQRRTDQALLGVVQGGRFEDLRRRSARTVGAMAFDGFGIGGEFGADKQVMEKMIGWVVDELPPDRPRHLLGIGHPEDIKRIVRAGVDTFDCTVPTQFARHGTAFSSSGRLNLTQARFVRDRRPIDPRCGCQVCASHSRAYLNHLYRAKEISALSLVTFHNLHYFHALVTETRRLIKRGRL